MNKLLAATLVAGAAVCAMPAAAFDMKGAGTAPCATLRQAYDNASVSGKYEFVIGVGQWAFGYLTGRNAEVAVSRRKDLAQLNSDETAYFILDMCARRPDIVVYQIVDAIYAELPYNSPGA